MPSRADNEKFLKVLELRLPFKKLFIVTERKRAAKAERPIFILINESAKMMSKQPYKFLTSIVLM